MSNLSESIVRFNIGAITSDELLQSVLDEIVQLGVDEDIRIALSVAITKVKYLEDSQFVATASERAKLLKRVLDYRKDKNTNDMLY